MKIRFKYAILFSILVTGCGKRYKFTGKACNDGLYVEFFQVNPAGVDAEYLTDSVSFRHFVGTIDEEHEHYSYACKGDSIYIKKFRRGDSDVPDTVDKLLEQKVVDLATLRSQHKFE